MADLKNLYDLIIVGSGPAGLTAALYGGRAKLRVLVIEGPTMGGQIMLANEIANYPAMPDSNGPDYIKALRGQVEAFGAEFAQDTVATADFSGEVKVVVGNNASYYGLAVVVATGAKRKKMGFDGEKEFQGRGITYCATCDGEFFVGKDVFVIGDGFAAASESLFLTRYAKKVTIVAKASELACPPDVMDSINAHPAIEVLYNTDILKVAGENIIQTADFENVQTGEKWTYTVDPADKIFGIFVMAGQEPGSEIFRGHFTVDERGFIPTDENMMTDVAGVYAAGDVRPKRLRQLTTACADGSVAATAAESYISQNRDKFDLSGYQVAASEKPASKKFDMENFFSDEVKEQIGFVLQHCASKVTVAAILEKEGDLSAELSEFLKKFAEIAGNEKVDIQIHYKGENPSLEAKLSLDVMPAVGFISPSGEASSIYYHGVPGGHELESFMLAIYNVAGPGQTGKIDDALKARAAALPAMDVKIAISLSCSICPDVVQYCQQLSTLNAKISTHVVDLLHYPEIQDKHSIMSLPALIVNDRDIIFGRKDLNDIITFLEEKK